ncbi:DUF1998 domain-containing protein [Desulfallas sp. Bu1-1]|uniref:DUF1998 domain-containing protein n=1 Tax=Desulfallas sp. Bu1-1 TaxID=2787620 RepID=UPI00189DBD03|nr:DUF1998 domain-containing protein [Desulfallas sp. Bu1-1]MBF7084352.1 DUF1998 domain-containing protein [Desulfallas sp. Bu1-1]
MATGQSIRPSQFITTYGPGSILEGPDGPRVISSLQLSEIYNGRNITDFEITEQRLSASIGDNAGIIRIPSNAELGLAETESIYKTKPFPMWSLCVKHGILYKTRWGSREGCPQCPAEPNHFEAWKKARHEAIRFVRACPEGHMDDVDWVGMIDHSRAGCAPRYLKWEGGGGALKHVNIECPLCKEKANLGLAYSRGWRCSGRLPEHGYSTAPCNSEARIIQRGAANLRIPELRSAITIPKLDTELHLILGKSVILTTLTLKEPKNKSELIQALELILQQGLISEQLLNQIQSVPEAALMEAVEDVKNARIMGQTLMDDEFNELCKAAVRGAPARPSPTPGTPPYFEVVRNDVKVFSGTNGLPVRVTPVSRLRVVLVQEGYRRMEQSINSIVPCYLNDGTRNWYPGVELFGEGIFIDLDSVDSFTPVNHPWLNGSDAIEWQRAWSSYNNDNLPAMIRKRDYLHPVFVWWHTLSHRIINALSVDSGYSSAAVRERVYVKVDERTGRASGGVLLYTVQPGGDGTLGGLIALVPQFDRILGIALSDVDVCSNDPLCGDEKFGPGKCNGAACYACLLISETSCEHRNMCLDRNLLAANLP